MFGSQILSTLSSPSNEEIGVFAGEQKTLFFPSVRYGQVEQFVRNSFVRVRLNAWESTAVSISDGAISTLRNGAHLSCLTRARTLGLSLCPQDIKLTRCCHVQAISKCREKNGAAAGKPITGCYTHQSIRRRSYREIVATAG